MSGHWTRSVGECRPLAGQSSLWVISAEQKQWSSELFMQVFSLPRGNKMKGAFSAQHPLLANTGCAACGTRGDDRSCSSLSVPSPLHILVWTRFCPDKHSWEDVCEDIKIPSTWEPLAVLWPPSCWHSSTSLEELLIPSSRICAMRQMQDSSPASPQDYSLEFKPCQKIKFVCPNSRDS